MKKETNPVWSFFASIKLAFVIIALLASSSIIGTLLQQGKNHEFYVELVGPGLARLFDVLDFTTMYTSWWFLTMLFIFSVNLIVCSIDRWPATWRLVTLDNLNTKPDRLEKMAQRTVINSNKSLQAASDSVRNIFNNAGWKTAEVEKDGSIMFASQKGAWTRLGVYGVHISILIIILGANIGSIFGYKGSVMIPEGTYTDTIFQFDGKNTPIPLDFEVRCDFFSVDRHETGAPREFTSRLVITQDGQVVKTETITVNHPMKFQGYTFYQSSYQAMENQFFVSLRNRDSNALRKFVVPPHQQAFWHDEEIAFGVVDIARSERMGKHRYKIWFQSQKNNPIQFWAEEEVPFFIEQPEATYSLKIKQRYATGLQVAKDPGVWTVYFGFTLMMVAIYVAFFMSHRRLWGLVTKTPSGVRILISGSSNKNKIDFERKFNRLITKKLKEFDGDLKN